MEIFQGIRSYVHDAILSNPVVWGIVAVILWIVGAAFIKAWRAKDEEKDG